MYLVGLSKNSIKIAAYRRAVLRVRGRSEGKSSECNLVNGFLKVTRQTGHNSTSKSDLENG
jgi:hypothetical protein